MEVLLMSIRIAVVTLCLAVASPAMAQLRLDLPAPSPAAKVSQTVGLTEVSVEYSSPAVRGRPIWGALVPYGQVWRAGANSATKLTVSKDVKVGDTTLVAGSYAIFVQPNEKGPWTFILNKNSGQWGSTEYKQDQDVLRVEVLPETIASRERLAFQIIDFSNDAATLTLEWEKVRLAVPLKLDTAMQVEAAIKAADDGLWRVQAQAARYHLDQTKNYAAALELVEKSLKLKVEWYNSWIKAQVLHSMGGHDKDAYLAAQKALELGDKGPKAAFFYAEDVKKALAEWKKK
jgi:hypothetical protein